MVKIANKKYWVKVRSFISRNEKGDQERTVKIDVTMF